MNSILLQVDAWVIAAVVAAAMLVGWALGLWRGRRLSAEQREAPAARLNDAVMALMGLLLAFTFSISHAKHDERRLMVVAESNSIGDFYTCASLLKEPLRGRLQGQVRDYVQHRLALAKQPLDEATIQQKLGEIQRMHDRMQALVGEAVDEGTPVVVPLVGTFNSVTSSHAARLAAARDRLPASIVLLLFLAAVVSMALMGRQQGVSGHREVAASLGFIVLVSMVVWVTLDLNQPQRGLITVSQEPLQRLLTGMGK
jgi:hypothetical protein